MANLGLIKKLREATGCGIADCNKALRECNDSYEDSVTWLRKKGLSKAAKKSGRVTSEGLIGVCIQDVKASIVEVNSETDFVARNDKFQNFVVEIAETALGVGSDVSDDKYIEELKNLTHKGSSKKVSDTLVENISVIGENLNLRRGKTVELKGNGAIVSYLHNSVAAGLGKIGSLVVLESDADKVKLEDLGKKIAMHIAAAKPECLDKESVSQEKIAKEKEILFEQAKKTGKPDNIIEKMMEGKIRKYYDQVVLLEQYFVMDDKKKISAVLKEFEQENGSSVKIKDYVLFVLGEGIEKQESNFAEEVASISGTK